MYIPFIVHFALNFVCVCLGLDIKGGMVAPNTTLYTTVEEHTAYYFNTHSRELLVQVLLISLSHTHTSK